MGKLKQLITEIQEDIEGGVISFQKIADFYGVPVSWVDETAAKMAKEYSKEIYDDSAFEWLTSAGDEPYGCLAFKDKTQWLFG